MRGILKGVGIALMVLTWPLWFFPLLGWVLFLLMLDSIREARSRRLFCVPLLAALLLTGCSVYDVTLPDGTRVRIAHALTDREIGTLDIERGDARLHAEGVKSDAEAVAEAVASAVAGALKP